jgi:phosphate starvation-inducible PhoH-like protein
VRDDILIGFKSEGDNFDSFEYPKRISKAQRRAARRSEKAVKAVTVYEEKPLEARNQTQQDYIDALKESSQIFAIGPAGTGKTYIAANWAMRQLVANKTDRIVLSRPTVTKHKHRQGFLPGNQKEKNDPWLAPIIDAFKDVVSKAVVDKYMREERVFFLPFETMRGHSLRNAVVFLDEAQNCDLGDLKLFLTRIGENSQVIVSGDHTQVDIDPKDSGLEDVLDMIEDYDIDAEIIEFSEDEVVRSGTAAQWVKAFSRFSSSLKRD